MSRARDNADLGDSYGSLGAGVTGGSGLTALGTVTLGNLSNSAIVYPAGFVLQTAFTQFTADSYSSSTSWNHKCSQSIAFTPKFATSNILLIAVVPTFSAASYGYWDFYKNASDVTETYNLSTKGDGIGIRQGQSHWESLTIMFLDPVAENSVSEKTYTISARAESASNTYIGYGASSPIQLTVQEIAT
jgi:hypothetical protein